MAVGHVVRLLTQIAFLTFLLCPGNADQDQSECKAPTAAFLSSCTLVRRVLSRCHRVKSSIVVWSKHGRAAIILPENQHSAGFDTVLLCGDIHPQPGPYTTIRRDGEDNTSRPTKRTARQTTKSPKSLVTIAHLNVRSIASRENFYLVRQTVSDYDIFTISETWLDLSTCDTDIHIPGYMLFRQDRGTHKKGGGLVVYVKNTYKASVVHLSPAVTECNFQQLWLKVQCKKFKSFLLCTAYRPPNSPISFLDGTLAKISQILFCRAWIL